MYDRKALLAAGWALGLSRQEGFLASLAVSTSELSGSACQRKKYPTRA